MHEKEATKSHAKILNSENKGASFTIFYPLFNC
jgi:hypothetical protein